MEKQQSRELSAVDIKQMFAETGRLINELRASQAETDLRIEKMQAETNRQIKRTNRKLEDLGIVQGEVAVDMLKRGLKSRLAQVGIIVDKIVINIKKDAQSNEYDIVASNGSEVVVIEVKNKLRPQDIEYFTKYQLSRFKEHFRQYAGYMLYGGMGALVVKEQLEKQVKAKGLFLLTQGADGNSMLHKPEKLRSF